MNETNWLPLAEYAMAKGVSISTVRRKIKSNAVQYKMQNGRYMISVADEQDILSSPASTDTVFSHSSDDSARQQKQVTQSPIDVVEQTRKNKLTEQKPVSVEPVHTADSTVRSNNSDIDELRWRALEARVTGLAKKVEYLAEQNSELKMLVKIFEEKLNATL